MTDVQDPIIAPATAHRDLDGARVIVTGGASGLGAAVVDRLEQRGASATVLDRQRPATSDRWHEVDLADARHAEDATRAAIARLGGVDAVVTCAGIDACGRLDEINGAAWDRVIAVNLLATAAVVRAALPALEAAHGRVVTVASTLGLRAVSDATAYCASKFGVIGFTRALAVETAGRIGVTLLVPGGMSTSFFDGRDPQYAPPPDAALNAPVDVADAIVFALRQPRGCEIRELLIAPSTDPSWP